MIFLKQEVNVVFDFSFLLFYSLDISPSFAYLGPGMSGGVIAAILGIIAAFFLGLFGIIYYPIKRILKKKKRKKEKRKKEKR